jgi:hypothetical protein
MLSIISENIFLLLKKFLNIKTNEAYTSEESLVYKKHFSNRIKRTIEVNEIRISFLNFLTISLIAILIMHFFL